MADSDERKSEGCGGCEKKITDGCHLLLTRLHRLDHRVKRMGDENLLRHGLTVEGGRLLHNLFRSGDEGITQKELSERLDIRGSSVTSLIQRLERDGLIGRSRGEDARNKKVFLTEKGRALDRELGEFLTSVDDRVFGNFTEEEKNTFSALIEKATANIEN